MLDCDLLRLLFAGEEAENGCCDPSCGFAVTVRVFGLSHLIVGVFVLDQKIDIFDDCFGIGTNQFHRASLQDARSCRA